MTDIKNKPIFQPGKKHYILCGDDLGFKRLHSIKEILMKGLMSFEEIHFNSKCISEVDEVLGKQKIGTYLYAAAEGEKLREIIGLASKLGYSAQESQFIRLGEEQKRIFCSKCHFISMVNRSISQDGYMICTSCGFKLELSDYYSPIKDAYFGYLVES